MGTIASSTTGFATDQFGYYVLPYEKYLTNDGDYGFKAESGADGFHLEVAGRIYGATYGVDASTTGVTTGALLTIETTGYISAPYDAIAWTGDNGSIDNQGTVASDAYGVGLEDCSHTSLTNSGAIVSGGFGVDVDGGTENTFNNSGTVAGHAAGLYVTNDSGQTFRLTNSGSVTGYWAVYGGDGSETIVNKGTMDGTVALNDGNDRYDGRSGVVDGNVLGGNGNDTLFGGAKSDMLSGDAGADKLWGGKGADTLTGGTEADVFLFKSVGDSTVKAKGQDLITDFSHADGDQIDLHVIDANTHSKGNQTFDFIGKAEFHHEAGELRYVKTDADTFVYGDVNGDGKADFAVELDGAIKMHAQDFAL